MNQVKWQKSLKVMETATEGKMIFLQHNNLNKLNALSARQCYFRELEIVRTALSRFASSCWQSHSIPPIRLRIKSKPGGLCMHSKPKLFYPNVRMDKKQK